MKPRSAAKERRIIANFILPALGSIKVADVNLSDASRIHYSLATFLFRQIDYRVSVKADARPKNGAFVECAPWSGQDRLRI